MGEGRGRGGEKQHGTREMNRGGEGRSTGEESEEEDEEEDIPVLGGASGGREFRSEWSRISSLALREYNMNTVTRNSYLTSRPTPQTPRGSVPSWDSGGGGKGGR